MPKLLIVAGPTATGKTGLGLELAKRLNGEIVSADSRHVYRLMDIGTGKDIPSDSEFIHGDFRFNDKDLSPGYRLLNGIPVWLVDAAKPDYRFNLSDYTRLADIVIKDISARHKLPVVVGGTGLYIKALITPLENIGIPIDQDLRKDLEKLDMNSLQEMLSNLNKEKLEKMNDSDRKNPRRLIRAIEISRNPNPETRNVYPDFMFVYLNMELEKIYKNIDLRIEKRLGEGIVKEIETLIREGFSFDLPSFSALPFKLFKSYFNGNNSSQELDKVLEIWRLKEYSLAKRQVTWFKKQLSSLPKDKVLEVDANSEILIPKLVGNLSRWYNSRNNLYAKKN